MPPIRRSTALPAALLVLALAAPAAAVTATGRLQIIQLDVGQGDGAVIVSPLGEVAMVDNGVYTNPTPACGVKVLAQLQALGVTHVKHHFASHYHSDHIGLMTTIFGTGGVALDYGWDRGYDYSSATYTNYVNTLGARRRTLVKGQVITLDSLSAHPVTITCASLNQTTSPSNDDYENENSVVLRISYGEFDGVWGGDLTSVYEPTVAPLVGPVEAYKVHHHGSKYSTSATWLGGTQPQVGIISVGTGNTYGHPTAEALARLHTAAVRTYWTELGAGVAPDPAWDKVSNGQVIISATWEPAGVDTIRGNGFAETFINSGTPADVTAPLVALTSPTGGEAWEVSTTHAVTWTATDAVGVTSVDVEYSVSSADGPWLAIALGLENTGTVDWILPSTPAADAWVRVTARDAAGNSGSDVCADPLSIVASPAGVEDGAAVLALARPSPNPSRGATVLRFSLPQAGYARLEIVDLGGRRVWQEETHREAGAYSLTWDGRGARGEECGAGLYFVRLTTPWGSRTQRLVRLQ